jgi:hypothetical protein
VSLIDACAIVSPGGATATDVSGDFHAICELTWLPMSHLSSRPPTSPRSHHPNHRRLALAHLSHSDTAFLPPRSGSPFRNFAAAPEPVDLLVEEAQRRNG